MDEDGLALTAPGVAFLSSASLDELAPAFTKAQASVRGAVRDKLNPHFRSHYADLASIWDACREALAANSIGVIQSLEGALTVRTVLLHASGQWLSSLQPLEADLHLAAPQNVGAVAGYLQAIGAATTYLRRYALAAMVGVAPDDEDGDTRQPRPREGREEFPPPPPPEQQRSGNFGDTRPVSPAQLNRLFAIGHKAGHKEIDIRTFVAALGFEHAHDLTRAQYDDVCERLSDGRPLAPEKAA